MFFQSLVILIVVALARLASAIPQPQNIAGGAATTTTITQTETNSRKITITQIFTEFRTLSYPTFTSNPDTETFLPSEIPSMPAFWSELPSLAQSITDVLNTAAIAVADAEATETGYACSPTSEAYFKNLPENVKSAVVSYQSAAMSWAMAYSSELGEGFPSHILSCFSTTPTGGGASATGVSGTGPVTGGGVVETGSLSSTISSATNLLGNVTAVVGSVTSTRSPAGAAPLATGAIKGSLAGIVGAMGVMAML